MIDSGFDLGSDGHGGAHWEAIGRSILVSICVPIATVAHIGKRLGFDGRCDFACDVGLDSVLDRLSGSFEPTRPEGLDRQAQRTHQPSLVFFDCFEIMQYHV